KCHPVSVLGDRYRNDLRVGNFNGAFNLSEREPQKAIETWQALPRDGLSNGYVIDVSIANVESQAASVSRRQNAIAAQAMRRDALQRFAAAIRGNPYVRSYYEDLGDDLLRTFRADLAWLCYDLGRALPGPQSDDSQRSAARLEAQLPIDHPDLF